MQVFCMCSYLTNNEPILPYLGKQLRRVKLVNKVLVTQFLFFHPRILMPNIKEITELVIVHLLELEDGLLRLVI